MIEIQSLLYDLDFRLNKLASNRHQSIPDEDKIIALNSAQIALIKRKIGYNNMYQSGLDSFSKRYTDLESLVISDLELNLEKTAANKYSVELSLVPDFMFFVKGWAMGQKGTCKDHVLDITLIPHADVQQWLANVHLCPSFEYQETFCCLSSGKLEAYSDGTFQIPKLFFTYIRYPASMDVEGYIHFNAESSTNRDCELPLYLRDELLDLAVLEIAMNTENITAAELTTQRLKSNE